MNKEPRRRRWGIRLLAIGLLLLGAPALLIWIYTLDEPPPDDADLLPARVEMPAEENAFEALAAAAERMRFPADPDGLVRDMVDGHTWDGGRAAEVLSDNREFFEEFDRALARGRIQVPLVDGFDAPRKPYLAEWKRMADLCSLMARARLEAGDSSASIAWGMKRVRFGHMIERDSRDVSAFMMGDLVRISGLFLVSKAVKAESSISNLLEARSALDRQTPSAEALVESLKAEYQGFSEYVEYVAAGKLPVAGMEIPKAIPARLTLRPNQTRRLMAKVVRDLATSAHAPWSERKCTATADSGNLSFWTVLLGNPSGKSAVNQAGSWYEEALEILVKARFQHDATRLLIALRAYQLEKGALPGAIEELAPRYIDAVPADPFDGKPMRYSAERRVIYSVGDDLQDAGGAGGGDSSDLSEPTVRIPF